MAFQITDLRKQELLEKTNILSEESDNGVYDIQVFLDNDYILQYNGKSYQGVVERYKQHIGKNGKLRRILDTLENQANVSFDKIELKTLKNYKYAYKDNVRKQMKKTESKIINKRQAEVLALKRKKVIFLNEQMELEEVLVQLFRILAIN